MAFIIQVLVGIHLEVKYNFSACDRTIQPQGFWICWSQQGVLSGLKCSTMWRFYVDYSYFIQLFSQLRSFGSFRKSCGAANGIWFISIWKEIQTYGLVHLEGSCFQTWHCCVFYFFFHVLFLEHRTCFENNILNNNKKKVKKLCFF